MSYADHDHRGDYADQRHDHDGDYAERHHRHYDDESTVRGLREDLSHAEERIRELEDDVRSLRATVHDLTTLAQESGREHDSDIRRLWTHIGNMPGGV